MTPAAHIAAAIDILDTHLAGEPAERALTNWGRAHRFAGSKDRAAIRDLVFEALRKRRSCAGFGQGMDGRAIMVGLLAQTGKAPQDYFTGAQYAPPPLADHELPATKIAPQDHWDLPDHLIEWFQNDLGEQAQPTAHLLRERAPIGVRVHLGRITREDAKSQLETAGYQVDCNDLSPSALTLHPPVRGLQNHPLYLCGMVELQDAGSQALCDQLSLHIMAGTRVLDYCAGGGGKSLALAAHQPQARFFAHDHHETRMKDIPTRAKRAGAKITVLTGKKTAPFDLVFCDVPCSGSGTWRRTPQDKWQFDHMRLMNLITLQRDIIPQALSLLRPGGVFAYMTCSIFRAENERQRDWILENHPELQVVDETRLSISQHHDGFFCCTFRHNS